VLYWVYSWAEEKTYQFVTWIQVLHKAAPAKACWCYNKQLCHQMTQYSWDLVQPKAQFQIETRQLLLTVNLSDNYLHICTCNWNLFSPQKWGREQIAWILCIPY
jgi:hypothetical protein